MSNKTISIYSDALKRKEKEEKANPTLEIKPKVTWSRGPSSDFLRKEKRDNPREDSRVKPTRDDIQVFSFRLRDELKVKVHPTRLTKPKYRAPGASAWKDVEWSWSLDEIAKRVKKARDASFVEKNDKGQTVNRTNALASVGSAAMDNEECYLMQKLMRSWGVVYIEHQARI